MPAYGVRCGVCVLDFGLCAGLLDPAACNFDPTSLSSNNCTYADAGYDAMVARKTTMKMGCATATKVAGCWDEAELYRYNPNATDAAACTYPETGYDCAGVCLVDTDGDGTCDAFELDGCTDAAACNYNSDATEEDGTCTYRILD